MALNHAIHPNNEYLRLWNHMKHVGCYPPLRLLMGKMANSQYLVIIDSLFQEESHEKPFHSHSRSFHEFPVDTAASIPSPHSHYNGTRQHLSHYCRTIKQPMDGFLTF